MRSSPRAAAHPAEVRLRASEARAAAAERRQLARARRRAGLALALVLVLCLALEGPRSAIEGWTPLWLRHELVAAYARLLPEPQGLAEMEPIAHVGGNPYGINVFLEQEVEETKIRRSLEMISRAGFGWIKQQLVWNEVEMPEKGHFAGADGGSTWSKYDRIVLLAEEYGLRVVFRIDTSPAWARPDTTKIETPPADTEDYGDFVARVAERYRGRVRHFQLWNEPNLPFEWGGRAPDAAEYTQLLKVAHARIKAVDPDAVVISAALAPTTELSEKGINDLVYLQRMYDAGAGAAFDVLAANAYGLRSGPHDRRVALDRDVNFSRPILVRQLMVRNGDARKAIWASEVGWNAVPEGSGIPDLWGRVDRETQAAYTARAYARAQREWPWMGVMNLWHFRMPNPDAPRLPQYYFNAVDEQFNPMPLFHAMEEVIRRPRALSLGYRQEDDWAIEYRGDWTERRDPSAAARGYREGEPGAVARIPFEGTNVTLVVGRRPGGGNLSWTIDGAAGGEAPTDGAEEWGVQVAAAAGLADGRHMLELRVADGPVRLDGAIVDRRAWLPGLGPPGLLFVLGVVGVAAAVAAGWRPKG